MFTDEGVSWQSIAADTAATVSADRLTLTVVGSSTNDGYVYRALASNDVVPTGVSAGAVRIVNKVPAPGPRPCPNPGPSPDPGNTPEPSPTLAQVLALTGTQFASLYGVIGATVLLMAAGLLTVNRIAARRGGK